MSLVVRIVNRTFFWLYLFLWLVNVYRSHAACHNDCNKKGVCGPWGNCECFEGWEGNDCSRRSCPSGPALADVAYSLDESHADRICSGQGVCNYKSGQCVCNTGFTGTACATRSCANDCSGRGRCLTLRQAAKENDGYLFNRTTVYNRWDADIISGCQCDQGWSGPDCSIRSCEYGPDPRLDSLPTEVVTMVCKCDSKCSGKFKLRYLGQPVRTWLKPSSLAYEVADAIMTVPGVFANNTAHFRVPVIANNGTLPGGDREQICKDYETTTTFIKFRRNAGDLPAISFYANLIDGGSLYFQTTQNLECNCEVQACNGTFRVSFDGEMSARLRTWGDGRDVVQALRHMNTVTSADISVANGATTPICRPGLKNNHTIVMTAAFGNIPMIGLWSSVVSDKTPDYYTTQNTTNVLRVTSSDGRDDNLKLCNGLGSCDFNSGLCSCPFGWVRDPDSGPCGKVEVNTSRWSGIGRCPGVSSPSDPFTDQSSRVNYEVRVYISLNPTYTEVDGLPAVNETSNMTQSGIYSFRWRPNSVKGPDIDETTRVFFLNLTSNSSAGPMSLDEGKERLFFVDKNPLGPFIGFAPTLNNPGYNFTVWLSVDYDIFQLAMDAHFKRRRLYWSVPGISGVADGAVYYADMDALIPPTPVTLVTLAGQDDFVDPRGLAVHYEQKRIYWVDRNISGNATSVLRSCNFDGSQPVQVYIYKNVDNHTVSTNLTDLVIDFVHNNTAFFLDSGEVGAVVATNLDFPPIFNNDSDVATQFLGFRDVRVITSTFQETMGSPTYLSIDEVELFVLWTDIELQQVAFARYLDSFVDFFSPGVGYDPVDSKKRPGNEYFPVAMVFDRGRGSPQWGSYLECYGNGFCTGVEGNWECQCNRGFFGDCLARTCPKGRAWFQEPVVDHVAHDAMVECSNMGVCNRGSGQCECLDGFEGNACERLACQGRVATSSQCFGRGRCLSMRSLARFHKGPQLDPEPVVYGSKASDPRTWDADMIHGCLADEYGSLNGEFNISTNVGSALDEFECPVGYNTRLLDHVFESPVSNQLISNYSYFREIQQIRCEGSSGYFVLKYRGYLTPAIVPNTTAEELQRYLEAIPTFGRGKVTFNEGQPVLCSTTEDFAANVTLLSRFGANVAMLEVVTNKLLGRPRRVTVTRIQSGTDEGLMECAGFGECNRSTGKCECWKNYGTSDGFGGQGTIGDCGFHELSL